MVTSQYQINLILYKSTAQLAHQYQPTRNNFQCKVYVQGTSQNKKKNDWSHNAMQGQIY